MEKNKVHILCAVVAFAAACASVFAGGCCGDFGAKKAEVYTVCQFNMRNASDKNDGRITEHKKLPNGKTVEIKDGSEKWEIRAPLIANFLRYNEVDICCTQELLKNQIDDMSKLDEYAVFGTPVDLRRPESTNNVVLYRKSKFKLMDSGAFWFSETPDVPNTKSWDTSPCIRNTNWGKFRDKKSGEIFFVFNSHFDHKGKVARVKAAEILASKVREIAKDAPFITTGDYNSIPDSDAIKTINATGFMKNAREICSTPPYGPKFSDNYGYTGRGREWKDWIDYIFVSDSVSVLKFGVLTDCINGVYLSDHFPLLTRLKIK